MFYLCNRNTENILFQAAMPPEKNEQKNYTLNYNMAAKTARIYKIMQYIAFFTIQSIFLSAAIKLEYFS